MIDRETYNILKNSNWNFSSSKKWDIKESLVNPKYEKEYQKQFKYYVYVFSDPSDPGYYGGKFGPEGKDQLFIQGKPFYVGKGTKSRCLDHFSIKEHRQNTPFYQKLKSILQINSKLTKKDLITIIKFFEKEEDAYTLETLLIKELGSDYIDEIKDGPLKNMILEATPPNHKNKTYQEIYGDRAEEERKKRHEKQLAVGGFFKGYKHSEETKERLRITSAATGKRRREEGYIISEETKNKISEGHKKRYKNGKIPLFKKSWKITGPNNEIYYLKREDSMNLKQFCLNHNLSFAALYKTHSQNIDISRGRTKGWRLYIWDGLDNITL